VTTCRGRLALVGRCSGPCPPHRIKCLSSAPAPAACCSESTFFSRLDVFSRLDFMLARELTDLAADPCDMDMEARCITVLCIAY
jgi:hypothetical protein